MAARRGGEDHLPPTIPRLPTRSRPEIPSEIWLHIFTFLRKDKPAPLSRPDRADLRQTTLCNLSRVCKTFEQLCRPLIYSVVFTDSLNGLLTYAEVPSKQHKLALIRSLYIEHYPVGEDPTYDYIVKTRGTWFMVGREPEMLRACKLVERREHLRMLVSSLVMFLDVSPGPIFTSLETIAIASLWGKVDDGWADYEETLPELKLEKVDLRDPTLCRETFALFRARCPKLRHYCVRDENSPLSLHAVSFASRDKPPYDYSQTIHFDSTVDGLCLPLGHNIKWVSDIGQKEDFVAMLHKLDSSFRELIRLRKANRKRASPSDLADIDIYFTTGVLMPDGYDENVHERVEPVLVSVERQREEAKILGNDIQDLFREGTKRKDMVRWHASADYVGCGACGSGPPV